MPRRTATQFFTDYYWGLTHSPYMTVGARMRGVFVSAFAKEPIDSTEEENNSYKEFTFKGIPNTTIYNLAKKPLCYPYGAILSVRQLLFSGVDRLVTGGKMAAGTGTSPWWAILLKGIVALVTLPFEIPFFGMAKIAEKIGTAFGPKRAPSKKSTPEPIELKSKKEEKSERESLVNKKTMTKGYGSTASIHASTVVESQAKGVDESKQKESLQMSSSGGSTPSTVRKGPETVLQMAKQGLKGVQGRVDFSAINPVLVRLETNFKDVPAENQANLLPPVLLTNAITRLKNDLEQLQTIKNKVENIDEKSYKRAIKLEESMKERIAVLSNIKKHKEELISQSMFAGKAPKSSVERGIERDAEPKHDHHRPKSGA